MKHSRLVAVFLVALCLSCSLVYAQTAASTNVPKADQNGKPVVVPTEPKVEALTELEQVQQQNVYLQKTITTLLAQLSGCQAQLAPQQSKANAEAISKIEADLKAKIEAAHPGFTYDVESGKLTPVSKPASATIPQIKK